MTRKLNIKRTLAKENFKDDIMKNEERAAKRISLEDNHRDGLQAVSSLDTTNAETTEILAAQNRSFTRVSGKKRPTEFVDLPLELRRQIYGYCLVQDRTITIDCFLWTAKEESKDEMGLLRDNKAISFEALEVLYKDNKVQYDTPHPHHVTGPPRFYISVANQKLIRHLRLRFSFTPFGIYYPFSVAVMERVSADWFHILQDLRSLIVAIFVGQGMLFVKSRNLLSHRTSTIGSQQMKFLKDCQDWLRPCLTKFLLWMPSNLSIGIECGGRTEIEVVAQQILAGRYREIIERPRRR